MEFFGAEFIMVGSAWTMLNEDYDSNMMIFSKKYRGCCKNATAPFSDSYLPLYKQGKVFCGILTMKT